MTISPDPKRFVTAQELAARFGVAVSTVRKWVREHRVPCVRLSRKVVRFDVQAVEEAARQGLAGGRADG